MKQQWLRWLALSLCVAVLAGCGPSQATIATELAAEAASQTALVPPSPTPPRTSRPSATPSPTATPGPLTAAAVFARLSPSIVFVDTGAMHGSGVLMEGGYIVTNAHVVWPYEAARVVFADGAEHLKVAVANWDMASDLAILGPLETTAPATRLVDGEASAVGGDVFLLGYPSEVDKFPQPTISSGVISRLRESAVLGITYFQTDAKVSGGQSGGVLASDRGEVIAISGFSFGEARYGLAASAADVAGRIDDLIAGIGTLNGGERRLQLDRPEREHRFALTEYWDMAVFVANLPAGTTLEVSVEGEHDAALTVVDLFGQRVLEVDETYTGKEAGSVRTEVEAPYFVRVEQYTEGGGTYRLRSNEPLSLQLDPDDGRRLDADKPVRGSLDHPGDLDYFTVYLKKGETLHLKAESALFDPYLLVHFDGAGAAQIVNDDDSGGGLFGQDAELTFEAPHTGRFFVVVQDAAAVDTGGYVLTARKPQAGDPTPMVPEPTATPMLGPGGQPMALYQDDRFAFPYPAAWTFDGDNPQANVVASFSNGQQALVLSELDLASQGLGETSLAQFTDLTIQSWRAFLADFTLLARRSLETSAGWNTEVVEYSMAGGALRAGVQLYVSRDGVAFLAMYMAEADEFEAVRPLMDYSFGQLGPAR